jgi:menaquinone-dependent protoporphyrinogen oxidase
VTVLVAYGSKRGSTKEVAEAIAEKLNHVGRKVEVRRAADVEDLTPYDSVVLGGSLYFGRWHADAVCFLSKHRRELSYRPVAVFAFGPQTVEPEDLAKSQAQLCKALQKVPEVEPQSIAVFGGAVDPSRLGFPLNRMPASDARDWTSIEAWTDEIRKTT